MDWEPAPVSTKSLTEHDIRCIRRGHEIGVSQVHLAYMYTT
jgi:hypothetical protein